MLDVLDAQAVRQWTRLALAGLAAAREEIDALNVFPVPDGDTGTNMYLTVESAAEAVEELPAGADVTTTLRALAGGALLGARGNSGIILSELLRGVLTTLARPPAVVGSSVLADALERAADMAYAAVARPVEGTMLTVARAAARAAQGAGGALQETATAAADAAHEALARTPDQLEALRRAGVVDAGGRGLTVLLDALVAVVTGVVPPAPARAPLPTPVPATGPGEDRAYEVMYLLDARDDVVVGLRGALATVGDSVVVVGGDGLWNVHAHVDDVGAAVEAGLAVGRPHRIRVTALVSGAGSARRRTDRAGRRAVVSVVAGEGLATLFETAGATVVRGGPGRRASTRELLDGIQRTGAAEVVVLPNDRDSLAVAEAAAARARTEGFHIGVIPTVATVQAIAALAVHEPGRRFEDDVVHMTAAASSARHGGVTVATRDATTVAGRCRAGDVLGIVNGDFVEIGDDLAEVARRVLRRMLAGGGELVTLVEGKGAPVGLATGLVQHLADTRPDLDTLVYDGGQPGYPLLLAVE